MKRLTWIGCAALTALLLFPLQVLGQADAESELVIEIAYAGAVYDSLHAPEVAYQRSFEKTSGLIDERGAFLFGGSFWIPWVGEGTFTYELTTLTPEGWERTDLGHLTAREEKRDPGWDSGFPVERLASR